MTAIKNAATKITDLYVGSWSPHKDIRQDAATNRAKKNIHLFEPLNSLIVELSNECAPMTFLSDTFVDSMWPFSNMCSQIELVSTNPIFAQKQ